MWTVPLLPEPWKARRVGFLFPLEGLGDEDGVVYELLVIEEAAILETMARSCTVFQNQLDPWDKSLL